MTTQHNKIILKKSSVSGKIPQTTDLEYGELALNYTDGVLYYKSNTNNVLPLVSGDDGGSTSAVVVTYDNTTSGLTATNVQDAIDELNEKEPIQYTTTEITQSSTPTVVDTFDISTHRTAKYTIQAESEFNVYSSEIMVIHDGTNAYTTEYAVVSTSDFITVSADISFGSVEVKVESTTAPITVSVARIVLVPLIIETTGIQGDLEEGTGTIDLMEGSGTTDLMT